MEELKATGIPRAAVLRLLAVRGHLPADLQGVDLLIDQGLAQHIADSAILSAPGLTEASQLLLMPREATRQVRLLMGEFDALDRRVRHACTTWQLRPDGSPNAHDDPGYDQGVRDEVGHIHGEAVALLVAMSGEIPELMEYVGLLDTAAYAFADGDDAMLASPLVPSYHTVWMWWHQELRLRLGLDPSSTGP